MTLQRQSGSLPGVAIRVGTTRSRRRSAEAMLKPLRGKTTLYNALFQDVFLRCYSTKFHKIGLTYVKRLDEADYDI